MQTMTIKCTDAAKKFWVEIIQHATVSGEKVLTGMWSKNIYNKYTNGKRKNTIDVS